MKSKQSVLKSPTVALQRRQVMADWISMKDRGPAMYEPVMFYDARWDWVDIGDLRQDGQFWTTAGIDARVSMEHVTHWQPLTRPEASVEQQCGGRGIPPSVRELFQMANQA